MYSSEAASLGNKVSVCGLGITEVDTRTSYGGKMNDVRSFLGTNCVILDSVLAEILDLLKIAYVIPQKFFMQI